MSSLWHDSIVLHQDLLTYHYMAYCKRHGHIFHLEIAPLVHWRYTYNRVAESGTLGGWRGHFLNHMQKTGPKFFIDFWPFSAFFLWQNSSLIFVNFYKFRRKLKNFHGSSYLLVFILSRSLKKYLLFSR